MRRPICSATAAFACCPCRDIRLARWAFSPRLDKAGPQLLASDAVSLRANLDQNVVPKNTWNKELYLQSFQRIREIEAAGATVICGHDAAQFEALRKGADFYE